MTLHAAVPLSHVLGYLVRGNGVNLRRISSQGNLFAASWFQTVRHGACQVPRCGTGGIHRHYGTCQDRYGSARDKILGPTKRDFCQRFVLDHQRNLFQWTPGSQGGEFSQCWPHGCWTEQATFFSSVGQWYPWSWIIFSSTFGRTKTVCLCRCQLDRAFNEMAGVFILFGLYEIFEPQCLYHVGGLEEWSDDRTIDIWPLLVISSSWIAGSFALPPFGARTQIFLTWDVNVEVSTSARNYH